MATAALCLARGDRPRRCRSRLADVRRRAPPARADRHAGRRRPGSTTPRRPTSRARSSRCRRSWTAIHLIAGGSRQAAGLLAAGAACVRALPSRVPDRRGGRGAGRGARARGRAAASGRRPRPRRRRWRARPPVSARSCCSRPPARATTSTPTSKPAATTSGRSWSAPDGSRRGGPRAGTRRRSRLHAGRGRSKTGFTALPVGVAPCRAAARAPHADDRDAVPAGVRRGDGLQRVLAAWRALERRGWDRRR